MIFVSCHTAPRPLVDKRDCDITQWLLRIIYTSVSLYMNTNLSLVYIRTSQSTITWHMIETSGQGNISVSWTKFFTEYQGFSEWIDWYYIRNYQSNKLLLCWIDSISKRLHDPLWLICLSPLKYAFVVGVKLTLPMQSMNTDLHKQTEWQNLK